MTNPSTPTSAPESRAQSPNPSVLQRVRELALQAANSSLAGADQQTLSQEVDELRESLDRIPPSPQRRDLTPDWPSLFAALQNPDGSQLSDVLASLGKLHEIDPRNGLVLMGLGIGHARLGEWGVALGHLKQAVVAAPKLTAAWVNLGNLHRQMRQPKLAVQAYEHAIEVEPGYAEAHYNLSMLHDEAGHTAKAFEALRRALLFKPDYAEAHNNLGHLLVKDGQVEPALSHFRQALVWAPALQSARFNLILSLYRLGRLAEANAEVAAVLRGDPANTQVLRMQAAGLMQMGQLDEADRVNKKLMDLDPAAVDLQLNQAELLLTRKNYAAARDIYQDLLQKGVIPPAVGMGSIANLLRVQANYSEALGLYRQAMLMDNRLPPLVLGHARALLDAGDLPLGVASLRRAVDMMPRALDVGGQLVAALRLLPTTTAESMQQAVSDWRETFQDEAPAVDWGAGRKQTEAAEVRVGFLVGPDVGPELLASLAALLEHPAPGSKFFFYQTALSDERFAPLQVEAAVWRPISGLGDADVVQQVRQDGVDVLIDTVGCGMGGRAPVLWRHAAPVQLTWLGDGIAHDGVRLLADCAGVDVGLQPLFHWPQPSNVPDDVGEPRAAGQEPTFAVLAQLSQLNASVLDAVGNVLVASPLAKLVVATRVAEEDDAIRQKFRRLLVLRDVEPERVQFVAADSVTDQAKVLATVDVVLDTFPVNMSPTLVLESLWRGIPVVTLCSKLPWGQSTQWCLNQASKGVWVVESRDDYARLASALVAQSPEDRQVARDAMRAGLQASGLMSASVFATAFVQAVKALWQEEGKPRLAS